ncbi:zinc-finger domain-containing protein [Acidihalobacter ferrooxydans]|uniref:Uncharacterized protein n=1 Tax=Acidihalobacter ferrooxydans TaxID=1765967 RepID=A0A1P8UE47_9GAMM|nr:zinc-finger domain-containing protein [Acidihalobacter ferrooxydans]APZ42115.1 hypothetical protein BW247_02565 [Acidihalobacter ferrooxydans]
MSNPQSEVQSNAATRVELKAADLPLHCPMPGSALWNSHPRVYLPINEAPVQADGTRRMRCPYCGTEYVLHDA